MTQRSIVTALGLAALLLVAPSPADAQSRNRGATGRAVPRTGPPPRPSGGRVTYYRPYYYRPYYYAPYYYGPFSPGYSVGLFYGYGYPRAYGPYAYGYPYGYSSYGYGGYGYYGRAYGSVRIDLPQRDAEVYADGYFVGTVDNFDGALQQLNLEPGAHRIEVRLAGFETASFEVHVEPGRTITYRTALRPDTR
jgi:hypothetical protein